MTASTKTAPLVDLEAAWRRTDELFALVAPEDLALRPIRLRHPLLFYVGHLPAFTWNMLGDRCLGLGPLEAELDRLFAFGIDPDDLDVAAEAPAWPPLARVLAYRDRVRARVRELAPRIETLASGVLAENARIVHLVLEHELMHHETLLYALQELDPERKRRPSGWPRLATGPARGTSRRLGIPAGRAVLGADFGALDFGWDNELPARSVSVDAFGIDSHPVTVGEFRRFLEDGGYQAEELWTPRARDWVRRRGLERPKDWVLGPDSSGPDSNGSGRLLVRTLFETVPLELAEGWPACVSWAEAAAYARWRGGRLPSEPELVRASRGAPDGSQRPFPWGDAAPAARHGAFDFHAGGPTPVGAHPSGDSAFGLSETVGNGWEWTATVFDAHRGFAPYVPGYEGYSADFFDGAHYVVLGASWATAAKLLRPSFRNWYRFNYPYPFTKFRVAWD